MPDEELEVQSSPEPEADYTALDALKELHPEETEETEEQPETEPEPDDEEEPADEASQEEEFDVPALREDVLETLQEHNPEAIKSWENSWKGLEKRERRLEKEQKEWEGFTAEYQTLFTDPDVAAQKIAGLIQNLSQYHGKNISQLMGVQPATTQEAVSELEFVTDAERLAYEKATEAEKRAMDLEARLSRFEKEQENARARAEQEAFVDSVAAKVAKQAEKSYSGFKVTREMVAEALRSFPQLKDAPLEAVAARFAKELYAHAAKSSRELSAKRGPDMLPKVQGRGAAVKSAEDYTAADALAELLERK